MISLLNLLYPSALYCICCGKIIDSTRTYRLCNDCFKNIKWVNVRTCVKCGKPLSAENHSELCYNCKEHSHVFRKGYTCAEYGTHERAILYALKYKGRTDIATTIGEILFDRLLQEFSSLKDTYDYIIPVPLYYHKKLIRGFNQSELITRRLASLAAINYEGEILERQFETKAMKGLIPEERRAIITGAFKVKSSAVEQIKGSTILVVDDIYTTGATTDEISSILYKAEVANVDISSFAAGADMVK
jgi:ComF family protein